MKNLILHKKGEASMVTYIKKRLKLNLNFICLFSGSTGIGKTWNGLSMAYQLDKEFDAEHQVTFDFQETMKLVNSDYLKQKKIKIILWDEPQISISNRAWQSQMNRLVNYLLSTFRHQNIVLIFCAPYQDFLDSQTMKLLHCNFKCKGVNRKTNLSRVLPRLLQFNPELKKTYQHSLYVINNGKTRKMNFWDIAKPPMHLIDVYERKKTEFTSALNQEIVDKLEEMTGNKEKQVDRKPLTKNQEKVLTLLAQHHPHKVAKMMDISTTMVYKHRMYALKKGYSIAEFNPDKLKTTVEAAEEARKLRLQRADTEKS